MQTRGPATVNDLSPSLVLVLGSAHVNETAERSRQRMSSLTKLQSSTRYGGAKPFRALNTSVAISNCLIWLLYGRGTRRRELQNSKATFNISSTEEYPKHAKSTTVLNVAVCDAKRAQ